jgi:iron(III) transport system permease protein
MNRIVVPIALLILLPIFGLAVPFFTADSGGGNEAVGTLTHLWSYVLASYIASTLLLVVGVGIGIFVLGVGNAWIIASYDFPGKRIFEWALILPLAVPTYVMAYLFVDLLQFSGPIQSALRSWLGVNSLWFFPDPRSLAGAIWSFPLCVSSSAYVFFRAK